MARIISGLCIKKRIKEDFTRTFDKAKLTAILPDFPCARDEVYMSKADHKSFSQPDSSFCMHIQYWTRLQGPGWTVSRQECNEPRHWSDHQACKIYPQPSLSLRNCPFCRIDCKRRRHVVNVSGLWFFQNESGIEIGYFESQRRQINVSTNLIFMAICVKLESFGTPLEGPLSKICLKTTNNKTQIVITCTYGNGRWTWTFRF